MKPPGQDLDAPPPCLRENGGGGRGERVAGCLSGPFGETWEQEPGPSVPGGGSRAQGPWWPRIITLPSTTSGTM